MNTRTFCCHCTLFLIAVSWTCRAAEVDAALKAKAMSGIRDGVGYLLSRQGDDGAWIAHPAVTGLAVLAVHNTDGIDREKLQHAVNRGLDYVLTAVQPDGSIWSKDAHAYPNYTTAISLLALATVNRPADIDVIKNARNFLMGLQFDNRSIIDYGGIGYSGTGRADLTNTSFAAEALYFTDYLDKEPYNNDPQAAKRVRELWERVQVFISNCQNLPEANKQPWVSQRPEDHGGFVYRPNESKAGAVSSAGGEVTLVSSGSVTYSGLKSMLYARMDKEDQRVRGAIDFLRRHYTLTENPGLGIQGLFFYLNAMTKAFNAYGEEQFTDAQGVAHPWRSEIVQQLLAMQKPDGRWENENGRYMESIPELVTAYSVAAMKIALGLQRY